MGEDIRDVNQINIAAPNKNACWLDPSMVAMATYILHACPIHGRYVRRGRGERIVRPKEEFFLSPKQVLKLLLVNNFLPHTHFFAGENRKFVSRGSLFPSRFYGIRKFP